MIRKEIIKITEKFGMKASVGAKAMGITTQVFYNNMNIRNTRSNFNKKNLQNLKDYIIREAKKLEE